jgi:uncharacterized oxidoreductase
MELTNNTILITGGTSGFGLEFTKRFLEMGNTVIITGRDQEKLDQTKKLFPKVHTFRSDVTDISAITALFETVTKQFPELNILINNAGEMRKINLHDTSIDLLNITKEVDINLSGPIRMVQQFLPHLKKQRSGAIMNVTSGIAFGPFPISPIYGATKSGLRSYTQSLRVQLSKTNIKVYELAAPGSSTPLSDKFIDIEGFNPKIFTSAEKVVEQAFKAMKGDRYEILPGLSKLMKIISRLAPDFALSQSSKMGSSYFLHS